MSAGQLAGLAASLLAGCTALAAVPAPPRRRRVGASAAVTRRPPPVTAMGAADAPTRHSSRLVRIGVTLLAGCAAFVLVGGAPGLVVAAPAALAAWVLMGRMEPPGARRHRERLRAQLPHVVDLMAAGLAVGLGPVETLEQVAAAVDEPVSAELDTVTRRLRLGVPPVTVWRDLGRHRALGRLGRAVARAVESGASVADALARLADDLRRDARSEVENRARAVGVRAAIPLGVCMLPAFVLVGVVPLFVGSVAVVLHR